MHNITQETVIALLMSYSSDKILNKLEILLKTVTNNIIYEDSQKCKSIAYIIT